MIQNANIFYKIELTRDPHKGVVLEHTFDIEDLEEDSISDWFIEKGYYPNGMGFPYYYYKVIERKIYLK